ncbi:MAG: M48 family metallopeptidase [Peptococcaceae bacterium]|jgi:STE24 endopeptidase|nr:M48 family metallopeptidase [Peptococcaceae bacterium]
MKEYKQLLWPSLVGLSALLLAGYLVSTLFLHTSAVFPEATLRYFTLVEVTQGRVYHVVQNITFAVALLVQGGLLAYLILFGTAKRLGSYCEDSFGGWGGLLGFVICIWLVQQVALLPFNYLMSYVWPVRWGLSEQTHLAWFSDYLIMGGLDMIMTLLGGALLFWLMDRLPRFWWLIGAVGLSAWIALQSYIWPVVVAPLFNTFTPLQDPVLTQMVDDLAAKADVPIDQILVMDASRQTNSANAYFAGLGNTKRVVLYDTLLRDYSLDEIRAVMAHELAHWTLHHIRKGILLGSLGFLMIGYLLSLALPRERRWSAWNRGEIWVRVLFFVLCISWLASPIENAFSRQMEAEADRTAISYTQDVDAAIRLHQKLAVKNLAEVAPPALLKWMSETHPPALERIELLEQMRSGR